MGLQGGGNRLIDLAQLFESRHHGHGPGARAPVLLGDEQAHQLEVGQLVKDLGRKILGVKPLVRVRRDLLAGEIATQVFEHLLFGGQFKIHTCSPLFGGRIHPASFLRACLKSSRRPRPLVWRSCILRVGLIADC